MSSPRNKKTKRSKDDDDDDDVDGNSKPPAKKRTRTGSKAKTLTAVSTKPLPLDALQCVMEFLPPRQLYHLALTCKTLRSFITTPLVLRAAMIHGGHSKQTIQEL